MRPDEPRGARRRRRLRRIVFALLLVVSVSMVTLVTAGVLMARAFAAALGTALANLLTGIQLVGQFLMIQAHVAALLATERLLVFLPIAPIVRVIALGVELTLRFALDR